MIQDAVCFWSELSSVTLTSSSSRRNCSWQLRALARAKFGRSCKWISRQSGKDPDGLTSFCGRYSEQSVPLDLGVARH